MNDMSLLQLKRQAVGALIHRGIALVRADLDAVKRAVILVRAMILAGYDVALNAVICVTICSHSYNRPFKFQRESFRR